MYVCVVCVCVVREPTVITPKKKRVRKRWRRQRRKKRRKEGKEEGKKVKRQRGRERKGRSKEGEGGSDLGPCLAGSVKPTDPL